MIRGSDVESTLFGGGGVSVLEIFMDHPYLLIYRDWLLWLLPTKLCPQKPEKFWLPMTIEPPPPPLPTPTNNYDSTAIHRL